MDQFLDPLLILALAPNFVALGVSRIRGVSIGGHLGGLIGGFFGAMFIVAGERGNLGSNPLPAQILGMVAIAVFSIAGAITVA